ncbi:type II secretion system F family protein [Paracraurococcus lichenis]|uniref:Type II secretion system F family protein n=1 Tax=Paracraurococcus lichenis TaxID=3064888 RepID=A0ABT9DZ25_9PROT|nr:type II secretion system F family protein [Paracraurococcus sp. LOR1-02]MDO9709139.1 type II secretion system F family protein [Paracraurococcus sp. LOR1-02]
MTPAMLGAGVPALLLAGAAALLGFGLVLAWMWRAIARDQRIGERMLEVQRAAGIDQVALPWSPQRLLLRGLAAIGRVLTGGGILSGRTVAELEQTLMAAGFRGDRALAIFVGGKVLLFLGLPLAAAIGLRLAGAGQTGWMVGLIAAAVGGLLLPDLVAKRLRKRYLKELERGLPDALDLMVICSEAGLALEGAIERVAAEIRPANRAVATEFALCGSELRILADRRAALLNMAERTGLGLLRRLGMTLAQTLQYGTPLTQALRTLSAEMRQEQLVRFEARAAKLPVLLTVPMILCILPTLFLVVAGPAMLQASRLW